MFWFIVGVVLLILAPMAFLIAGGFRRSEDGDYAAVAVT